MVGTRAKQPAKKRGIRLETTNFVNIQKRDMNVKLENLNLVEIKLSLQKAIHKCYERGLLQSTKWLCELHTALMDVKIHTRPLETELPEFQGDEEYNYMLVKSYFDLKEYDRCAYFTETCTNPCGRFLHLYSRYMSGEKKRINDLHDAAGTPDPAYVTGLRQLALELRRDHVQNKLDGFSLYLYGVVLQRLQLLQQAADVLTEAIQREPLHWGAWLELASLINERSKLDTLMLPDHWMKYFFLGHAYLEQQLNDEALGIYTSLQNKGFHRSNYITAQIAIAYHNKREVDMAISQFRLLRVADPYRLENLDIYSNLLYVKESRVDLAYLAHQACEIDKYRVETCCIIANYYSLRSEHQKSVLYFQRAIKLNPNYLSSWTLMGHEYMEMKNSNAAILSYRQAIEVNRRDYRAWYGLGQTYEVLKMMCYCVFYYKKAQQLRPNDSRMLIALGETFEKMDKIKDAITCYYKARNLGDIEGSALLKMAKLFDKLNQYVLAQEAYRTYVIENEHLSTVDRSEICQAYRFLATYYVKTNQLDDANIFCKKCLEHDETKEEGKALLRTIAQKRREQDEGTIQVSNNFHALE